MDRKGDGPGGRAFRSPSRPLDHGKESSLRMQQIMIRGTDRPMLALGTGPLRSCASTWLALSVPDLGSGGQVQLRSADVTSSGDRAVLDWEAPGACGSVTARIVNPEVIELRCELVCTKVCQPEAWGWSLRALWAEPQVLTDSYRLESPQTARRGNRLTPVVLRGRGAGGWLTLLGVAPLAGHEWTLGDEGEVRATFWLDHHLAHPRFTFEGSQFRNWHNAYRLSAGHRLAYRAHVWCVSQPMPLVVPGRYPRRCRAVFSITDHADHDSCERLAALWYGDSREPEKSSSAKEPAGFVGLRLPLTKSVFTATPQADGPGLHYPRFAELCRVGYRAGIEICPHGVHSTNQPQVAELEALLGPFEEFHPLTWIDHGNRFLSNYGRRGWNPDDEFTLHPWLERLGIRFVWGRLDFGHALPHGQLDQLEVERFCGWSYVKDLPLNAVRALAAGRPWAVLHGLSTLAFQLIPERTMLPYFGAQRSIQRVMRADVRAVPKAVASAGRIAADLTLPPGVGEVFRHFTGVRAELQQCPIFFPEHYSVERSQGHDLPDGLWLFNTLAVHDVQRAYAPATVQRLIQSYGIHLSHTYLTSVSRAHLSHAIEPSGDVHWRLTSRFGAICGTSRHSATPVSYGSRRWVRSASFGRDDNESICDPWATARGERVTRTIRQVANRWTYNWWFTTRRASAALTTSNFNSARCTTRHGSDRSRCSREKALRYTVRHEFPIEPRCRLALHNALARAALVPSWRRAPLQRAGPYRLSHVRAGRSGALRSEPGARQSGARIVRVVSPTDWLGALWRVRSQSAPVSVVRVPLAQKTSQ